MANVAKISATQFQGGGGSGDKPVIPTTSQLTGSSGSTANQAPIVNFSGTGSGQNEQNAGSGSITINTEVKVSETEITSTQQTVQNLMQQSQL